MGPWRILEVLSPRAHGVPPPWASILEGLASILEVFGRHVGSVSGAVLLLFWSILAQELFLDGLVGLREALRILN